MSSKKYIGEKEGAKVYLNAMSPQEIRDADLFLESLQTNICSFEKELSGKLSPSSLECKYRIGEFYPNSCKRIT